MISYKQDIIVAELKRRVETGFYTEKLPNTNSLAAEFKVNLRTLHKALDKLVDLDVIYKKRGVGTFVSSNDVPLESNLIETLYVGGDDIESSGFFSEIWRGMKDVFDETSFDLSVKSLEEDKKQGGLKKVDLDLSSAAGYFLLGTNNDRQIKVLKRSKRPFVIVNSQSPFPDVPAVYIDTKDAVARAVKKMIKHGRRSIAFIGLTAGKESMSDVAKFHGYLEGLHENGLEINFDLMRHAPAFPEQGYLRMKEILKNRIPSAVFCAFDNLCPGIYQAINEKGLRIPEDIGVVGCDGQDLHLDPPLSSIEIPRYELGRKSAETLLDMVRHPRHKITPPIILKAELRINESF